MTQNPLGCEWNSRFQTVRDQLRTLDHNSTFENKLKIYSELEEVASEFTHIAKTYAAVIVQELHLPNEQKSIKPLQDMKGAGGEKYGFCDVMMTIGS